MTITYNNLNFTRNELPNFVKEKLQNNNLKIAEIGVEYGGYLDIYYPQFKMHIDKIYLVDLWETEGNDMCFSKAEGLVENGYKRVKDLYGKNNQIELCKGYSSDIANKFPDSYFDYIYIDGDHTKQGVLSDLNSWYSKVKTGGIIAGHDIACDRNHPYYTFFDVEGALEEFFNTLDTNIFLTSEITYKSWIYIKK